MKINLFFLLILLFPTIFLPGQNVIGDSLFRDQFKLRNGLIFNGNLKSFDEKLVVISLQDGSDVRFNHSDLVWIRQYGVKAENVRIEKTKVFIFAKPKNYFFDLGIGIVTGGGRNNGFLTGGGYYGGIQKRIGQKWNSSQFVGISSGYEILSGFADYITVPLTLGYTNMWVIDRIAPYISGNLGYGFASVDDSQWWGGSEERLVKGGLRYELATGIAFRMGSGAAFNIRGGYVMQRFHYMEASPWWGTNDVRESLSRIFLRIGIQF